jgi:TolA-binding protein
MNPSVLCPDDLLAQARAGTLGAAERAKLSLHLQRCASCRATWQLGQDFDAVLAARAGDDQIAARIAARLTAKPRRRWFPYAAAAAALLTGSVAAAAVVPGVWQALATAVGAVPTEHENGAKPLPAGAQRGIIAERAPSASTASADVTAQPSAAVAEPKPEAPKASGGPAAERGNDAPAVDERSAQERSAEGSAPEHSAAELFAQGNVDRRNGKETEARAAYRKLQQHFPASVEAKVSLVSLGRLERASNPAAALRLFDAYLAQSAHTTLAEEALFGRASSLQALGRAEQEQATWRELLRRFPSSVYAERAQARLSSSP